jgi:hypothetical protein
MSNSIKTVVGFFVVAGAFYILSQVILKAMVLVHLLDASQAV